MGAQAMIPEPPEDPPRKPPQDAPDAVPDPVADLPPIDSIDAQTDLAPWLKAGVPAALRNAALRRKWLATPAIRDYVDPALDYAWDWNAAASVPGAAGRIAADAARKMLRALTDPPAPAPSVAATETGAAPAGDAGSEPPEPGAEAAAQGAEPPATAPEPAARPQTAPRPRRHGGALPQPRG